MSETAAPAHRGRLSSLARLWPFARPYRGLVALTFAGTLLADLGQMTVPLVARAVVGGPIARGDRGGLVPLLGLALVFGVAEAFLFFLRRWAMNVSSLQIERDLRNTLYQHDLPWGLATRIGEQGLSLSGGQRQRLALARAVLGRPSVLVLDDPLSALDVHTEKLVERALREVLAGTTALVVAHRASTVLVADRVALLEGGRIAAVGTHSELLAEVPAYRDLLAQESELVVP